MPKLTVDDDTILVHVGVVNTGSKYELRMFPQRAGDTAIFHTKPGDTPSPEKPREVRWVAHGLATGQWLDILEKTPGSGVFPSSFSLNPTAISVSSGHALIHPVSQLNWSYCIYLCDATHAATKTGALAYIDPEIVVSSDP